MPEETESGDRVYDPETGEYIFVDDARSLVDTIQWKAAENPPLPVTEDLLKPAKEAGSELALLIPLHAYDHQYMDHFPDARTRRFMHFYAGAKLAMDSLAKAGFPLRLRVFDTNSSLAHIDQLVKSRQLHSADLIIGPYDRELIREIARYGDRNRIPVISPWHPSTRSLSGHPWLVQTTPGFYAHTKAIVDYIRENYAGSRIVVVGRDNSSEKGRVDLFTEAFMHAKDPGMQPGFAEQLIISDASAALYGINLREVIGDDESIVFIMPYFLSSEENFVLSFLRKLHAEKGSKKVVVFGLPQWMNYQNLNSDYLESLQVHISANHFIDRSSDTIRQFEHRFFETYACIPEAAAYQGFDLVYYFGKLVAESGRALLDYLPARSADLLAFGFHIIPYGDRVSTQEPPPVLEYYENDRVMILKFEDQAFHKAP